MAVMVEVMFQGVKWVAGFLKALKKAKWKVQMVVMLNGVFTDRLKLASMVMQLGNSYRLVLVLLATVNSVCFSTFL